MHVLFNDGQSWIGAGICKKPEDKREGGKRPPVTRFNYARVLDKRRHTAGRLHRSLIAGLGGYRDCI